MVLAKSKNAVGLGNSLMNDRFGKSKNTSQHRVAAAGGIQRTAQDGSTYITNNKTAAAYEKMRSVTEQAALDEFLSTAELAGTDFTAEKLNNVKIIHADQKNPYLLSAAEERGMVRKMNAKRARLTVPRRPQWDTHTTPPELDRRERESLLDWRRGLAELQEVDDLLMTPFERNLEVWRQLWRVIERSDLVVQIVDARNPLLFRCEDLEKYVKEVDGRKRNLLLVNKADMLTLPMREAWTNYFRENGINFRFFSAELAREMNEARLEKEDVPDGESEEDEEDEEGEEEREEDDDDEEDNDDDADMLHEDDVEEELDGEGNRLAQEAGKVDLGDRQEEEEAHWVDEKSVDPKPHTEAQQDVIPISNEDATRILTTDDLEALFVEHSPSIPDSSDPDAAPRKTQIGLVGYPNVGKSSTINALLGAKKVSVSATPGKTKHFQTIHLSPRVILCDCPGLVFPNFATTKAELVCNGILPIDQLREYTGPATLVATRIPQPFLEAIYGMKILTRPLEEGGTGTPTGEEVLRAYARARGFQTTGLGQPDESRAARYVLKDYVRGKLLFCRPPPMEPPTEDRRFNRELHELSRLPQKRRARAVAPTADSTAGREDASSVTENAGPDIVPLAAVQGAKSQGLDKAFFAPGQGSGVVAKPFHYKYSQQGKAMSGRKAKSMVALERGVDAEDVKVGGGKKHFKANKRAAKKVRDVYD